ncbi:protein C3orf33 homolog isoform X3 [Oncorhynchus kisutch]|uniref:protein C3orf33 homolog isoform X3 n=1 Tax=Oncorhynchus kisutch TaxID=8019 RepID=UPI0012DC5AE0|nr:protein C3orf33 homolog isoform X3 [Oncorhynchus kisutch]
MPESRSEAETDEKGETPSKNIISVISQFADDNLTIVRNISTGLAIAGITKFGLASEIPARFIEKNVSLRGRVQTITETGLEVEHIPIYIPVLSPLLAKGGGRVYPLAVRLAGVELTPEGRVWLEQHLSPAQTVWLKLVSREEETLHCLVSVSRGSLRSLCLNEEVLRLGLARTVPVSGLHPQSHLYLRLHQRLLKAEVKAERKGRGMWKEDSLWERTSQAVWDNSLVRLIRRIFKWT